jgi:hydroxymethylpyrimidine/phosphomethylpyrimidine kinase
MLAAALTIAGSDPSGGAGIQADLKTFHQFGVYGEAAIALLTVQNTLGVSAIELIPGRIIRQQIESVLGDIRPAAIKTGALGGEEAIQIVAELVLRFACPLVVDPVMVSTSGHRLLAPEAERALHDLLLPRCTLVTPNIAEAQILSGASIANLQDAEEAALRIGSFAKVAVLVKGGHLVDDATDVLYLDGALHHFRGKRVHTPHTHGSGCTYSAAITALLAKGHDLISAIRIAKAFVQRAIETAPGLGRGNGPLNHFASTADDFTAASS